MARVASGGSELLAIDRDHEYRNSMRAAAAGVGAPVIEYAPEVGVLVIGYIDGTTLTNADVARPANLTRIARACRALHAARAVRRRLRHVRDPAPVPSRRGRARHQDPGRVRRARRRLRRRRAGAGQPAPSRHRPVQQRPARGQLHRRRQQDLADRLRVLGQQRPVLRARQHLGRVPPARRRRWPP